eukprot:scaffold235891_cov36-Tisochrysis_lutea.AAC.2
MAEAVWKCTQHELGAVLAFSIPDCICESCPPLPTSVCKSKLREVPRYISRETRYSIQSYDVPLVPPQMIGHALVMVSAFVFFIQRPGSLEWSGKDRQDYFIADVACERKRVQRPPLPPEGGKKFVSPHMRSSTTG